MYSLKRIYWEDITYSVKMSFDSHSTNITMADEGHKLGLHNLQNGKNKNRKT